MKFNSNIYLAPLLFFFMVLTSVFVALRDLRIGTDSLAYARVFSLNLSGSYDGRFEPGILWLMSISGLVTEKYGFFLFLSSLILVFFSFLSLMIVGKRDGVMSSRREALIITLFAIMLISPFFFANQVNIIRHGLSAPFLLLSYFYFDERRYKESIAFGIIAIGFHWSAAYFLALMPLLRLDLRNLLVIVLVLSAIYLTNVSGIILKSVAGYLSFDQWYNSVSDYASSAEYRTGVRFDFWAFSTFFILLSLMLDRKLSLGGRTTRYMLVFFIPFLLIGFIAFSDRLLVFLWFMIPLVLCEVNSLVYRRLRNDLVFWGSHFFLIGCVAFSISRLV